MEEPILDFKYDNYVVDSAPTSDSNFLFLKTKYFGRRFIKVRRSTNWVTSDPCRSRATAVHDASTVVLTPSKYIIGSALTSSGYVGIYITLFSMCCDAR